MYSLFSFKHYSIFPFHSCYPRLYPLLSLFSNKWNLFLYILKISSIRNIVFKSGKIPVLITNHFFYKTQLICPNTLHIYSREKTFYSANRKRNFHYACFFSGFKFTFIVCVRKMLKVSFPHKNIPITIKFSMQTLYLKRRKLRPKLP